MNDKDKPEGSRTNDWVEDGQALEGSSAQSRRAFLRNTSAVGLLGGFALAAQPIMAQQVITTNTDGLVSGRQQINENGVQFEAYISRPKDAVGKLPLIVVCSEIFGVHEHIADITRRFAKLGYMAIAPEFFSRVGNPAAMSSVADIIKEIVSKTPDAQVMTDIKASLTWAQKNGADITRAGVTGFCWGGRITWLACAQIPEFKAGVAWYGRLVGEKSDNFPMHPVDVAKDLKAPVLGLYGAADTGIPLDTVEQMKKALAEASGNKAAAASRFEVYPDAPHAFHADYRPSYRDGPAKDGWQKCLAWFKQNGV